MLSEDTGQITMQSKIGLFWFGSIGFRLILINQTNYSEFRLNFGFGLISEIELISRSQDWFCVVISPNK